MSITLGWQDEIVLLPVPLRHAHQVAEFAATLVARVGQSASAAEPGGEESVLVQSQGSWTRKMVAELADAVTYEAVVALIDRTHGA